MNQLLGFMLDYPVVVAVVCVSMVGNILAMTLPRNAFVLVIATVVLLPASPIMLLRGLCASVVDVCDWTMRDRVWTRPLVEAIQYMGLDDVG